MIRLSVSFSPSTKSIRPNDHLSRITSADRIGSRTPSPSLRHSTIITSHLFLTYAPYAMKVLSLLLAAAAANSAVAFSVGPQTTSTATSSTQLFASVDRRAALSTAGKASLGAILTAVVAAPPAPANAFKEDYVPKADDVKQIYFLGASLDRLVDKLSKEDTIFAASEGLRMFNKDINFYPGYARNFLLKSMKTGVDSDPRYGYIKEVSTRCFRCAL